MGCRLTAVSLRGFLSFAVVQVRKVKPFFLGVRLHIFKTIVVLRIPQLIGPQAITRVRIDRHKRDAFSFQLFGQLHQPRVMRMANGAMVGGKVNHQKLAVFEILQRPIFVIDAHQFKLGRRVADFQFVETGRLHLLSKGRVRVGNEPNETENENAKLDRLHDFD